MCGIFTVDDEAAGVSNGHLVYPTLESLVRAESVDVVALPDGMQQTCAVLGPTSS